MKRVRISFTLALITSCFSSVSAQAECMGSIPRFVEMEVQTCSEALPLALASIEGKHYEEWELQHIKVFAADLVIVHARMLADVDLITWYSRGDMHHYRGVRDAIRDDVARDYMASHVYSGCKQLSAKRVYLFNVNPEKPCRDVKFSFDGKEPNETDPRLLIQLPEIELIDEEGTTDIATAKEFWDRTHRSEK